MWRQCGLVFVVCQVAFSVFGYVNTKINFSSDPSAEAASRARAQPPALLESESDRPGASPAELRPACRAPRCARLGAPALDEGRASMPWAGRRRAGRQAGLRGARAKRTGCHADCHLVRLSPRFFARFCVKKLRGILRAPRAAVFKTASQFSKTFLLPIYTHIFCLEYSI